MWCDRIMTDRADSTLSIQDRFFTDMPCFGCGPMNLKGLRLKSFPADDGTVRASFRPWPEHDNGLGYLNGGIIATLLDCHGAAAVVLASAQAGLPPDGTLQYVTAGLDVRYRRPSPLHDPVDLVARAATVGDDEMRVDVELWWQEKVRATAEATWKRWRPRPGGPPPPTH
jgi:acyl-coenzyme A thioesterase PaaI-like protein